MKKLQDFLENILFTSRWLLAPLYLGLVLALLLLMGKFAQEFIHTCHTFSNPKASALILSVLELVDLVLVTNLLLMIIFSGYENFISKIEVAEDHKDRPSWMGRIDYSALKLKIIGSVVAISSIELLKLFLDVGRELNLPVNLPASTDPAARLLALQDYTMKRDLEHWQMIWKVGLHGMFVISGLLFAYTEKISHTPHPPHAARVPAAGDGEKAGH